MEIYVEMERCARQSAAPDEMVFSGSWNYGIRHCVLISLLLLGIVSGAAYASSPPVSMPPIAPGMGRVLIYRPWHYAASAAGVSVALNGNFVGMCRARKYFYVDMPPGVYYMRGYFIQFGGIYNAVAQTFGVQAGKTANLRLNIGSTYSVEMMPSDTAANDLNHLHFDESATADKDRQSEKHIQKAKQDFANYLQSSGIPIAASTTAATTSAQPGTGSMLWKAPPVMAHAEQPTASLLGGTVASANTSSASVMPSGTPVALVLNAHCPHDPDPLGVVSGSLYSGCKPKEMNQLRDWIISDLAPHGIQVLQTNTGFLYQFGITVTKDMDKRPSTLLPFSDFMAGTVMFEATYQIQDAGGHVLASGTVAHQGPDKRPVDEAKLFAQKIASTLSAVPVVPTALPSSSTQLPAVAAGTASSISPASAQTTTAGQVSSESSSGTLTQAEVNLYEIVAKAYRSLAMKPQPSDAARAQDRIAEELMSTGDFQGAAAAYRATLTTDAWWPQEYRGLALALSQAGHSEIAILWMQRYLAFVPEAPDAPQMQAKLNAWTRQMPPAPARTVPALPPGEHLGIIASDTPGVVAAALGHPDMKSALITFVYPGSIGENAGLQKGDLVLSCGGNPVGSALNLAHCISATAPGTTIPLIVQRETANIPIQVSFSSSHQDVI